MAVDLTLSQLRLHLVRLPTRATLGAAHDASSQQHRDLVYVEAQLADSDLTGWGEVSALNAPGYTDEWAAGAFEVLGRGAPFDRYEHPMATAGVEMAMTDLELRVAGQSLADRVGTAGMTASAGAVVGLGAIPDIIEQVATLVEQGYRRIKAKIGPGHIVEPVLAIAERFPGIELQVDANGSLGSDDFAAALALYELGVVAIEQPFAVGELDLAARLVRESPVQVVADESVSTVEELRAVAQGRAATAVSIKPPRVGGLAAAQAMLTECTSAGLGATVGGMLESGLGRHQLASIAPLAGFTITGDLSPAGRWLAKDPFPDIGLGAGTIAAPTAIGIAGDPDLDLLEHHTLATTTINPAAILDSLSR